MKFLLWATNDHLAPIGLADVFAQGLPQAEVAPIANAEHALILEQAQPTAGIVTQFLQRK